MKVEEQHFHFQKVISEAFTVTEDSNNYYINIKILKEVYSKVVLLDAGHGGNDLEQVETD